MDILKTLSWYKSEKCHWYQWNCTDLHHLRIWACILNWHHNVYLPYEQGWNPLPMKKAHKKRHPHHTKEMNWLFKVTCHKQLVQGSNETQGIITASMSKKESKTYSAALKLCTTLRFKWLCYFTIYYHFSHFSSPLLLYFWVLTLSRCG